jgi:dipeptidyl aminopeptidase/acylaminoacyl peptidase
LWSPDSKWFLTHRIDERALPDLAVIEHAPPQGGRPVLHSYKYAMPGDPLPVAVLVAANVESGQSVLFEDFPFVVQGYSPFSFRLVWFSGVDQAWFLRFDRYFKKVDLIRFDLARGTARVVLTETASEGYLEFHQLHGVTPNVRTLEDTSEVIWFSERDGWGHLYLYDMDRGELKNRITSGDWMVRDIIQVDVVKRRVLFTACGLNPAADPVRRSLCAVNLDGSGFEVLLSHDGDITVPRTEPCGIGQERPIRPSLAHPGVSPDGRFAALRYTSVERGNTTRIVDLHSRQGFVIASAVATAGGVTSRSFTALAADGVTRLHGTLFVPSDFDERRQYPLVDYIYPGPQTMVQPQAYRSVNAGQAVALAELGFVTMMLDSRCLPFRSRALHQAGYGELLEPQLADHAAVVRQLCQRHRFLDGTRVGIFGSSGGGYATAKALFDYGDLFKVGVSVCGNHDNRYNIAFWSEKYCGPGDPASCATKTSGAAAHRLNGKLLLISGDMDENVHLSHTLGLVDALIRANRDFDLLVVPNEGHHLLLTNGYVQRRVFDYFVHHLLGETPPRDFDIRFEQYELARMRKQWVWEWWS